MSICENKTIEPTLFDYIWTRGHNRIETAAPFDIRMSIALMVDDDWMIEVDGKQPSFPLLKKCLTLSMKKL